MKYATLVLLFVLAGALAGCASGSALVTGQARPPIQDHTTVLILTEMPKGAEQIAIVKASSDAGWTQQGSLDYAVEELKEQAAKVGQTLWFSRAGTHQVKPSESRFMAVGR